MRMWKVPPELLCDQHLRGEHVEMHMFEGCLRLGKSVQGYIDKGLVELHNIKNRHNEIAKEMIERGMNHKSPATIAGPMQGKVNVEESLKELARRCPKCRERQGQ